MKRILIAATTLIATVISYQFDAVKAPTYPVIFPQPWNITFGSEAVLVCDINVTIALPQSFDIATSNFVTFAFADFVDNQILYSEHATCNNTA